MHRRRHSPFPRSVRVADEIKRILSSLFATKIQIVDAGLLTVTDVVVSSDLRHAKIYFSLLNPTGDRESILAKLHHRTGEIRHSLGSELQLKYVPEIRFYFDEALEQSERIESLLAGLEGDQSPET